MIVIDDQVVWSASDLTTAAGCEYAFLRRLDEKFKRVEKLVTPEDPLQRQIGDLGLAHERRVLEVFEQRLGPHVAGAAGGVTRLGMAGSISRDSLELMAKGTLAALVDRSDVVFQAGFFDGEFHGYADFLRRTDAGWVVADTKIARTAKVSAMLQVAAYADQIARMGLPVAPTVEIILGTRATVSYPLAEILPVFRERRERLRSLIARHAEAIEATDWYSRHLHVCGSCADCSAAAEEHDDLVLVAGMRMSQREKLRTAGHTTVGELAIAETCPDGMSASTFIKLRAQAAMQRKQMEAEALGKPEVFSEVFDAKPIHALPSPSPGDLFFDFEGDPMYHVEGSDRWGLEYLWGVQQARRADGTHSEFWHLWADHPHEERAALIAFLDRVTAIRAEYPDMHIYHYAAYEVTALKKLVAVHKTHEDALDELLRHGVFVDLYATVRSSVRVSQPSYSIKMLEPLYMEERVGEVMGGDASIAEYRAYRDSLGHDEAAAEKHRANLVDYNTTDCVSTLELRDWLLRQVDPTAPGTVASDEELPQERLRADDEELVELRARLLDRVGTGDGAGRGSVQQAWAMLESALGYYKREDKPFWWAHFDRLRHELTCNRFSGRFRCGDHAAGLAVL